MEDKISEADAQKMYHQIQAMEDIIKREEQVGEDLEQALLVSYIQLADYYVSEEKYDVAKALYNRANEFIGEIFAHNPDEYIGYSVIVKGRMGMVYDLEGQPEKAETILKENLDFTEKIKNIKHSEITVQDHELYAETINNLVEFYDRNHREEEGIDLKIQLIKQYKQLGNHYQETEKIENALECYCDAKKSSEQLIEYTDKRIEEIAELSKEEIEEKDVVDYVEFSNAKNEYFKEYIEIEKNILLTFKKIHFEKQVREYSIGIKSQIEENLEKEIQMKNKWEKVKSNIEDMYDLVIEHEENRIEELTEFLEEMKKELKI